MTQSVKRAMVLVLDSFGIGASRDAAAFGDEGANTLLSIASYCAQGHCEQGRQGKVSYIFHTFNHWGWISPVN